MLINIIICIAILSLNILLIYYLYFFIKLINLKQNNDIYNSPVSIIICAKNELENLKINLPKILNQDYLNFEVIVVDDQSIDGTAKLLKILQKKYSHLVVVSIEQHINHRRGKKFALTLGIKTAKYTHLLLTDADCQPISNQWVKKMCSNFHQSDIVLGYGFYEKKSGFLNKIIRYDTFNIAQQYMSYALRGYPYMGVGRNMAYKKSLFFENNGFGKHIQIPSGDDDLFIQDVANNKNVSVELSKESHTISKVIESWKSWIYQKRRHTTTAPLYKTKFKILLAIYPLSLALYWSTFILLIILKANLFILIILLAVKLVYTYTVNFKLMKKMKIFDLYWIHPIYEIFHIIIQGFFVLLNLFNQPKEWSR